MKTRICNILGIQHPIIQGGMARISEAGLVSAVSNAGGLGVLTPFTPHHINTDSTDYLREEIRKVKSLTDKPFGVNFPMPNRRGDILSLIEQGIDEGFPVATTSGGNPSHIMPMLKGAGVKVLHVVSSVRQAQLAEECGCDAVITQGFEAGGIGSRTEVTTFVLVPQIVKAVNIPVIAGGGIADAYGLVAAFALGAEGIHMGTRFLATKECIADEEYKKVLTGAGDTDTLVIHRNDIPSRVYRNEITDTLQELERMGASKYVVNSYLSSLDKTRGSDIDRRIFSFGEVAGLVSDILTVEQVITGIVKEAENVLNNIRHKIEDIPDNVFS